MTDQTTCSESSRAVDEPLLGTASSGSSWLLVEVRAAWGKNVSETELPPDVSEALASFPGTVLLMRRPDRRQGVTVIRADASEICGTAVVQELDALEGLPATDPEGGAPVDHPIVLVCAHGRRDACCARYGPGLFSALDPHLEPSQLWQSSHQGGHRFAPNVLVLPHGVQLGRVPVERAAEVAALLLDDRIPLDLYRGRTIYAPAAQAAEVEIRREGGFDRVGDLRLVAHGGDQITFSTPAGEVTTQVEERIGPLRRVSCGVDAEAGARFDVEVESNR